MTAFDILKEKIKEVAEPIVKDNFMEIAEIEVNKAGNYYVKVVIDKQKGSVSIDDCANLSEQIALDLDVNDVIPGRYFLEVSSPGTDRPLKKREDFLRFKGERVKIVLHQLVDNQAVFSGHIMEVTDDKVIIEQEGKNTEISFSDIKKANLDSAEDDLKHKRG